MPTPRQLALQDRQGRLGGRLDRLEDILAAGDASAQQARRYLRTGNQLGRVNYRLANQTGTPGVLPSGEQQTPLQMRQGNMLTMLQNRQSRLQNVAGAGVGGQGFQRRLLGRQNRIAGRIADVQGQQSLLGGLPPPAAPPAPGPAVPSPTTGADTGTGTLADLLAQYQTPAPAGTEELNNLYLQGISRLNALPQPSFEDQYGRWRDVADREANRQAAAIRESFGSRGARYGSDLLRAEGDLRQRMNTDLAAQSDEINARLNQQRLQEMAGIASIGQGQQQLEQQRQQNALQLLFADAMRRTGLPPGLAAAGQWFGQFGAPTTLMTV